MAVCAQFPLTAIEDSIVKEISLFSVLVYIKAWMQHQWPLRPQRMTWIWSTQWKNISHSILKFLRLHDDDDDLWEITELRLAPFWRTAILCVLWKWGITCYQTSCGKLTAKRWGDEPLKRPRPDMHEFLERPQFDRFFKNLLIYKF